MSAWKEFERDAAALFGAKRHWANSGERLDFTGDSVIGQCKLTRNLSLEKLTQLAEEMDAEGKKQLKLGVVCTKVRRGKGSVSPMLVTMTAEQFMAWLDIKKPL